LNSISPHDTSFDPIKPEPAFAPTEYAGFLIRFVAYLIDSIIIGIIGGILMMPAMVLYFAAIFLSSSDDSNIAFLLIAVIFMLLTVLIEIVVVALYYAWFESSRYMGTPGKILLKLKVTDANGNRISLVTALLRFILKTILNNFFWIGSLFILFSDKKQGIYDLLLNTYVIKEE